MKQQIRSAALFMMATSIAMVAAQEDKISEVNFVMSPTFVTGLITVFFLYVMLSFGFGQLSDIQVPPYQLQYDDRNKDNNRDWLKIWGEIEN